MGIYDSMAQKTASIGQQMGSPNAMGQGFAQQKQPAVGANFGANQQMRANPIMQNRPATMNQGFQNAGNQLMQAYQNRGQGQQPNPMEMLNRVRPGMMGSRNQIMQNQLAAKNRAAMNNYNPLASGDLNGPSPISPDGLRTGQLPNLVPPGSQGVTSDQLSPAAQTPLDYGRPDVMNRNPGIGPSNPMEMMSMNEVQPQMMGMMDENGLELRRGPR